MKSASVLCWLLTATRTDAFVARNSRLRLRQLQQRQERGPSRRSLLKAFPSSSSSSSSTTTALAVATLVPTEPEQRPARINEASAASSFSNETSSAAAALLLPPQFQETASITINSKDDVGVGVIGGLAVPEWAESFAWRGVIVVLCALWASNFAVAKLVMGCPGVDSSLYALSRFAIAAAALAPFAARSVLKSKEQQQADCGEEEIMDAETLKEAIVCGSWVAFGYLGQTLGLMTTTASKSCVICSMHCVFVAIVAETWRVQKLREEGNADADADAEFDAMQLLPAAIAVLGVAIVELKGAGGSPTIGDALSFAQPIGFGTGYLILERLMEKKPEAALPVSAIKLAVVAAASLVMFEASPLLTGGSIDDIAFKMPDFSPILSSPVAVGGILYTGLITTALALWVESIAFAKVPATDASLILTTEPLFAAGCGAVALGETFGTSDYVGASLIVGACALSIFMDGPEEEETAAAGQQQVAAEA